MLVLGVSQELPWDPNSRAQAGENSPGEQPLSSDCSRALPGPTAYWPSALALRQGCRVQGLSPACLACNKTVYSTLPSRNKTTESKTANRCLRPGPRVPARCSFENLWRGEARSLVPPDPAGWGGGAAGTEGLGATKGLLAMEQGGNNKERGHDIVFLLSTLFPYPFQPGDLRVSRPDQPLLP